MSRAQPHARVWAVVVAAGESRRFGRGLKQFASFFSQPLVVSSLTAFNKAKKVAGVILVVPKPKVDYSQTVITNFNLTKVKKVVAGGAARQDSVYNGLLELPEEVDLVIIHDGVRPNITAALIDQMVEFFPPQADGFIAAVPVFNTLKVVNENLAVQKTVDRKAIWQAQTPQIFKLKVLKKALNNAQKKKLFGTDEAQLVEAVGGRVYVFPGSPINIKVTTTEDLIIAEKLHALLSKEQS